MDELQNIQNLIYEVRGVKVMLDKDLAELQAKPSDTKTRKPIGFIQPEDDDDKK